MVEYQSPSRCRTHRCSYGAGTSGTSAPSPARCASCTVPRSPERSCRNHREVSGGVHVENVHRNGRTTHKTYYHQCHHSQSTVTSNSFQPSHRLMVSPSLRVLSHFRPTDSLLGMSAVLFHLLYSSSSKIC